MWPCRRPAKKARRVRVDGRSPPRRGTSLVLRLISGNDASLDGLNPSEVLALQKTLMDLWNNWGTKDDVTGPYKINQ